MAGELVVFNDADKLLHATTRCPVASSYLMRVIGPRSSWLHRTAQAVIHLWCPLTRPRCLVLWPLSLFSQKPLQLELKTEGLVLTVEPVYSRNMRDGIPLLQPDLSFSLNCQIKWRVCHVGWRHLLVFLMNFWTFITTVFLCICSCCCEPFALLKEATLFSFCNQNSRKRFRSSTRMETAPSPPKSWEQSCALWARTRQRQSCRTWLTK